MEKRFKNEKYEEIGTRLIQTRPELAEVYNSAVSIIYLESDKAKKKNGVMTLGECEKISPKNQWAIEADFAIVIYTPNIGYLTEDQLEILLLHELMHIGVKKSPSGAESYYIVPHDLEEFRLVAAQYGIDWAENKYKQMDIAELEGQS